MELYKKAYIEQETCTVVAAPLVALTVQAMQDFQTSSNRTLPGHDPATFHQSHPWSVKSQALDASVTISVRHNIIVVA